MARSGGTAGWAGATALWAVAAATPACAAGADGEHGAQVYKVQCAVCHGPQGGGAAGPSLVGVVGRKAAAAPGFAYSAALKKSGWSWTGPHLDTYLANPQSALPGTLMPAAVPSPKDRADVVAFLSTLKPAGKPSAKGA